MTLQHIDILLQKLQRSLRSSRSFCLLIENTKTFKIKHVKMPENHCLTLFLRKCENFTSSCFGRIFKKRSKVVFLIKGGGLLGPADGFLGQACRKESFRSLGTSFQSLKKHRYGAQRHVLT